jgi:capsular polysaccharide biosynthesis protein
MELRVFLREVWRYLFFITGAVLLVAVLAFFVSNATAKTYTAESRLVVTAGLGTDGTGTDTVLAAPRVGQTYAVLATTMPVLQKVIDRAGLSYDPVELLRHLNVTANLDTPFLVVTMIDKDPAVAAATANALGDVLVEMSTVASTDGTAGRDLLAVVEAASVPTDPSGPRVLFNTVLAAAAALVIALVIVALVATLRHDPAQPSGVRVG